MHLLLARLLRGPALMINDCIALHGLITPLFLVADTEFTCEYKYDGERAQIHVLEDGTVSIYSRNAENNTGKYPDIVGRVKGWLQPGVKSIVLDTEAVAWDPEHKKIKPFQVMHGCMQCAMIDGIILVV